jgi:hypothetical protein
MELFPFSVGCENKGSCDRRKLTIRNLAQQLNWRIFILRNFQILNGTLFIEPFVEIFDCFAMASNNKTFYKAEHCYSLSIQMAW